MGFVYVLHFDKPYKHAMHYIGYVDGDNQGAVNARMEDHKAGRGARLMDVITKAGIGFTIAWIYDNVDRKFERKLKNKGGAKKHCQMCIANKKRENIIKLSNSINNGNNH